MISTDSPTPCQDNPDPFDAVLNGEAPSADDVAAAVAICRGCTVQAECLSYGRSVNAQGVFGGRLLGLKAKGQERRREGQGPACVNCGQERPPRNDRPTWSGCKGMCDRCYQANWRAEHGMEPGINTTVRLGVDTAKVERAICGEAIHLNADEREAAVRYLAGRGLSDAQTGFLLRITDRSVVRIRKRCGIAPGIQRSVRAS